MFHESQQNNTDSEASDEMVISQNITSFSC